MHIVDHGICGMSNVCAGGGLAVLGDAGGGVSVISPSDGIVAETLKSEGATDAVTALTSFIAQNKSVVILAGHSNGALRWHVLSSESSLGHVNKLEFSSFGTIPVNSSLPWRELHAYGWHKGKYGLANIAGITADGQVAVGRIQVGEGTKGGKSSQPFDPLVDTSLAGDGARFIKMQLTAVDVLTTSAQVTWGPLGVAKHGKQPLRPTMPCEGWARHQGIGVPHFLHAVSDVNAPAPRIFAASEGGRLVTLQMGAAPGRPVCRITGAVTIDPTSEIDAMAAIPGYVVALTRSGQLHMVNISGSFLKPALRTFLQQPFEDLTASIPGLASRTAWWTSSKAGIWRLVIKGVTDKPEQRPLMVGGMTRGFPAMPDATGLVLIQLSPQVAGLYATAFPYNPTPKPKPSLFRINWIAALQPLFIAGALGMALHKAKVGRRQPTAAQIFRARARLQDNELGDNDGDRNLPFLRGTTTNFANLNDDHDDESGAWDDETFPWEKRERDEKARAAEMLDSKFMALMGERKRRGGMPMPMPMHMAPPPPLIDHAPMPQGRMGFENDSEEEIGEEENEIGRARY